MKNISNLSILKSLGIKQWLDFLLALTEKEIKARYKHALLGFLWVILNPILQMLVIGFVFQFFIPLDIDNYFVFLFTGLLPWNFFSMSITKTTPAFVYERSLIQKAKFPRESIVLSIVLSNLFHLVVSMVLLMVVLVFLGNASPLWLLLPFNIIWLGLLTSGISLFTSSLNVKYRDVNFMVQAAMPLWFYATPIVYSLSLLPDKLHWLFYLNPMTSVIEVFRFLLLGTPIVNPSMIFLSIFTTIIIMIVGIRTFKKESPYFDDWI